MTIWLFLTAVMSFVLSLILSKIVTNYLEVKTMRTFSAKREFENMVERFGSAMIAQLKGGKTERIRAIVNNYRKRHRGYGALAEVSIEELGLVNRDSIIIYTRWRPWWDGYGDIRLTYRGRSYDVVYDTAVCIGDDPLYVWAIANPCATTVSTDYDNLDSTGGDDNAD